MIRTIHDGCKPCMRINGILNKWFNTEQRLKQRCLTSPWIFKMFIYNCLISACNDFRGMLIIDMETIQYC